MHYNASSRLQLAANEILNRVIFQLKPGENHNLDDHDEAVAAFNLALNAFVRGNRRTCLEILQSVMIVNTLSG